MSIFDQVSAKVSSAIGGISGGGGLLASAAGTIGMGMLKSKLPIGLGPKVSAGIGAAGKLLSGDISGAVKGVLNSGVFTAKLPWLDGAAALVGYVAEPSRATGGLRPLEAKRIIQESLETNFARKNLFIVSIKEQPIESSDVQSRRSGGLDLFNMFVLDVSYGPITITADSHKIGSAVLDQPNGTEAVELRITTLDDEHGTIKSWFTQLSALVTHEDGTMGVPADYLAKISITHSFVTDESSKYWLGGVQPWKVDAYFRPVSMEFDLSRKEDAFEEFTMVFHQFDTYYK